MEQFVCGLPASVHKLLNNNMLASSEFTIHFHDRGRGLGHQ